MFDRLNKEARASIDARQCFCGGTRTVAPPHFADNAADGIHRLGIQPSHGGVYLVTASAPDRGQNLVTHEPIELAGFRPAAPGDQLVKPGSEQMSSSCGLPGVRTKRPLEKSGCG